MSEFKSVAKVSDFDDGQEMKSFVVDNIVVAVCKVDNEFYAFADECSHQTLPLSDGFLTDKFVTCPFHGAEFDIKTGEALCLPAVEPIETFEVKVENDEIFVKLD